MIESGEFETNVTMAIPVGYQREVAALSAVWFTAVKMKKYARIRSYCRTTGGIAINTH